jgi:hypothetical protein
MPAVRGATGGRRLKGHTHRAPCAVSAAAAKPRCLFPWSRLLTVDGCLGGDGDGFDLVPVLLDLHAARRGEADVNVQAVALDAQVVLLLVWHEGLNDKGVHGAGAALDGHHLAHALVDELLSLCKGEVEPHQVVLPALPEEHVRLDNQLCLIEPWVLLQQLNEVCVLLDLGYVDGQIYVCNAFHSRLQQPFAGVLPDLHACHGCC